MNGAEVKKRRNSGKVIDFMLNNKALVILVILVAAMCIASPDSFATSRNLMNILRQCSYSICMGVGFTLVIASGHMDLSVGYMLGFLGVVSGTMAVNGVPAYIVIPVTLLAGAICGSINGAVITYLKVPFFIATLGMQQMFRGVSQLITHNKNITGLPSWYTAIGQKSLVGIPVCVIIMLVLAVIGILVVRYTRYGRYVLATGGNRSAATACGINTAAIIRTTYIIMGLCAAIGALILTGRASAAQVSAGQGMEMDAIAAVVIGGTSMSGGRAKVVGTVFGCLIVGVITNGLSILGADTAWQIVGKGLMIVLAVLLDSQTTALISKRLTKKQQQ